MKQDKVLRPRRDELLGRKFYQLTVRERVGVDKGGNALYLCDCDCGGTTTVPRYKLGSNWPTKSCGCLRNRPWAERVGKNKDKETAK